MRHGKRNLQTNPFPTMREAQMLQVIAKHPDGIKPADLATELGLSKSAVHARACVLRKIGAMVTCGAGPQTRHCMPENAERCNEVVAQAMRESRERELAAARRADKARRDKRAKQESRWPVVQRKVSAEQAKPLKKLGPASVFELGAM